MALCCQNPGFRNISGQSGLERANDVSSVLWLGAGGCGGGDSSPAAEGLEGMVTERQLALWSRRDHNPHLGIVGRIKWNQMPVKCSALKLI